MAASDKKVTSIASENGSIPPIDLPVEAVVDAVDGVHRLRVHGDEPGFVLLHRRLLLVYKKKGKNAKQWCGRDVGTE